tara:strand:+ start:240 stop:443 length:204 start_codon:yes stop_codon:yes gene_type:complete
VAAAAVVERVMHTLLPGTEGLVEAVKARSVTTTSVTPVRPEQLIQVAVAVGVDCTVGQIAAVMVALV